MKSDYHINLSGSPLSQDKILNKLSKDNKKRTKNYLIQNYRSSYVTKNNSVFLDKGEIGSNPGDLDVDNKCSYYIGRHIIRDGDRPQRIMRSSSPMSEFYNLNKELFDKNEINVDANVIMNGCFKSNKNTLQQTMIPEFDTDLSGLPTFAKIKRFEPCIKSAIRKLKIVELAKCYKDDLKLVSFNSTTYPGFHLDKYANCSNKLEASSIAMEIAETRWDRITESFNNNKKLERNKIFPNTFVVGARNKREYLYEDGEILTSRAVHMPEFHSEINSSIWIEQLTNHFKDNARGPIYIGNSMYRYERLLKDIINNDNTIEGDWKRFDSRLYITNVIIGLAILRLYFDHDDREIDYHFLAMFDTIGIKDYITPGGHLYRMIHGLPSGICSTSILGSIINLVNLLYCTKDFNSKRIKFIVGGDDFLVSLDNELDCNQVRDSMMRRAEEIGQVFKILDIKNLADKNILNRPCFFKYTIDRNEAVVFPTSLLERTFMPWNKKYDSNFKIVKFLDDLIPSLGSPRTFHLPFYAFYCHMYERVTGVNYKYKDIFLKHKNIYRKILSGKRYYKDEDLICFKNFSQINKSVKTSSAIFNKIFLRNRVRKIHLN